MEKHAFSEKIQDPEYLSFNEGVQEVLKFITNRDNQQTIIAVYGTSGSGKTTFIEKLESYIDGKSHTLAAHIDSYKDPSAYEFIKYFKVFIIHAGGAVDKDSTECDVHRCSGKKPDLSIYIKINIYSNYHL